MIENGPRKVNEMKTILFLLSILIIANASDIIEMNYDSLFNKRDGTIVVYNQNEDKYIIYNRKRSNERYTPCSTFKIPNSIIILESKLLKDVNEVYILDSIKYPPEDWWPKQWHDKHNMRSAIKYSVVPFYRDLAYKIGKDKMVKFLNTFNYGNMDISSGIDSFWLNGSIKISAMEQIDFLRRFYHNKLNVSDRSIKLVKIILLVEENDNFKISAKTGGTSGIDKDDPEKSLGWYVGYVEKEGNVYFFACNIDGKNFMDIKDSRIEITRTVLNDLKITE